MIVLAILALFCWICYGEIASERMRGEDEPNLVSWRVLEGITEPYATYRQKATPAWKQMKMAADQKAASMQIQQALHEYGQLLRHPYMFGEMPSEERYDVFLSMAKLLKMMNFYQRAELLLYEAMSHSTKPFEAHMQLGLLFLDKEDLEGSKVQFKNCLFYNEQDVTILSYLTFVLIMEGKMNEAKFYLSRIIANLETKVKKLSILMSPEELGVLQAAPSPLPLPVWLEQSILRVLRGDFHVTPVATFEYLRYFTLLYSSLSGTGDYDLRGRALSDLGVALYEAGRIGIAQPLLLRGVATSDALLEGGVSHEVVAMRAVLCTSIVPLSLTELIEGYVNITRYLAGSTSGSRGGVRLSIEDAPDIYPPLPHLLLSSLPLAPLLREVFWRFSPLKYEDSGQGIGNKGGDMRYSPLWLPLGGEAGEVVYDLVKGLDTHAPLLRYYRRQGLDNADLAGKEELEEPEEDGEVSWGDNSAAHTTSSRKVKGAAEIKVNIGVWGGHLSSPALGYAVLYNLLTYLEGIGGRHSVGGEGKGKCANWKHHFSLTLLIPPQPQNHPVIARIRNKFDHVVTFPSPPTSPLPLLDSLHLDIIIIPDFHPFPPDWGAFLSLSRLAPLQICMYVRGGGCGGEMDYYLLPTEVGGYYLRGVPPASILARKQKGSSGNNKTSSSMRLLRPPWRELVLEQVVLLDWPTLTPYLIHTHLTSLNPPPTPPTTPPDLEGVVFFDQPVCVCISPPHLHPLMDPPLLSLLSSLPTLQILIVRQEGEGGEEGAVWGRKLARRLWIKGGNLSHRVRILPSPLSETRLKHLLGRADVVLDSFPIGASAHVLALALGQGTPVVTMKSGTTFTTPAPDLLSLRNHFKSDSRIREHPLYPHIFGSDLPYIPMISNIEGVLREMGVGDVSDSEALSNSTATRSDDGVGRVALVTHTPQSYQNTAITLLTHREVNYEVRVRILENIDYGGGTAGGIATKASNAARKALDMYDCPGDDLGHFLYRVGLPWATHRLESRKGARKKSGSGGLSKEDFDESYKEFLKLQGLGAIVQ